MANDLIEGQVGSRATPERFLDYTAVIELSVTADSPEEAARFALDDLRDSDIASWTVKVTNRGDGSQVDVAVEMETSRANDSLQKSIENVLGGLVAGMHGLTTEDSLCADWRAIHGVLVLAQDRVQKDGTRHTWLDGAIALAKSRSEVPIPAAYLRRDASEAVESPVVSERPSGGG